MAKTRLRTRLLLIGLGLLMVPVMLLLAEAAVRVFARRVDPLSVFITSPQLRSDTQGEHTSGLFEFDPELTWRLRPNLRNVWWDFTTVTTNGSHLRMDREVGPNQGVRILCLGDSVTFGYRVPIAFHRDKPQEFDPAEQPYPLLLEKELRARFPNQQVEVLPLACPGYSSAQGLAWLRREIAACQPDLVTVCFGWNDVRVAGLPDRVTLPAGAGEAAVRRWMGRSQLLLHIAQSAQRRKAADIVPRAAEPRASASEYVANIAGMHATCTGHGAAFLVILPVYRDRHLPGDYPEGTDQHGDPAEGARMMDYRNQLQAWALQNRVPHLLVPELTEEGWPANAGLFGERIHPNAAGHRLLAERALEPIVSLLNERSR